MLKRTKLLRRTPIKRVSARRQREGRIYREKREAFLKAHPFCQAWAIILAHQGFLDDNVPRATDIHHVKGRGKFYLDESTWLAVCRESHNWIHNHPKEAQALGLYR